MPIRRLVLIHTVPPLVEVFTRLAARELPGVALLHVLDEPLLERVRQNGGVPGDDAVARLEEHLRAAALVGADAALVTCSTVSPAVDGARAHAAIPVVKIDDAMIAEAVRLAGPGRRIGVIATNPTTLAPTSALIQAQAADEGISVAVETQLVAGALASLLQGNTEDHDTLVARAILEVGRRVDVIVLAQATMARVLDEILLEGFTVPVLSSPRLALRQVAALLKQCAEVKKPQ